MIQSGSRAQCALLPQPLHLPNAAFEETRWQISEMRASCISSLRREFGGRVLAGFAHSEFAKRHFPGLLVPDPRISDKRQFLRAVQASDVCVTTTGVHESIGWKLAEYVALGKAIVTEPITQQLPGTFAAGVNYLDFTSAEECVAMADALLSNPDRRRAMGQRNRAYYERFLWPDQLVLRTLGIVQQDEACIESSARDEMMAASA